MPKRQLVEKTAIQFKIDSARQCQLGRRSRPPQSLPSSWHSYFRNTDFTDYLERLPRINPFLYPRKSAANFSLLASDFAVTLISLSSSFKSFPYLSTNSPSITTVSTSSG